MFEKIACGRLANDSIRLRPAAGGKTLIGAFDSRQLRRQALSAHTRFFQTSLGDKIWRQVPTEAGIEALRFFNSKFLIKKNRSRSGTSSFGQVTCGQPTVSAHTPVALSRGWKKSCTQPLAQQALFFFYSNPGERHTKSATSRSRALWISYPQRG